MAALTLPAAAGAQVLAGPGETTETAFRREIRGHWFAWLAAQEEGDTVLARGKAEEILKHAQKLGIKRLSDLALSATLIGRREALDGRTDLAREAFETAVRLDPGLPEAHLGRMSLGFKTHRWGDALKSFFAAVSATLTDREARRVTLSRLKVVGVLTLATAGALLVLLTVARYAKLYAHDLSEVAGKLSGGALKKPITLVLLLLPLFLSLDVLWLVLVLYVAVWGYATLPQRAASWVGLLTVVSVLPVLDSIAYDYATDASPVLRGAEALAEARYDQRVLDNLEGVKNVLPDDPDVRFLLGRLYQSLGQNDRAVSEYTMGAQVSPAESRCLVNRGNIHFVDGDYGSAQEDFLEALKRDSRNVAARYNLGLTYNETFRQKESEEALAAARALDAHQVARWQASPTLVKVVSQDFTPEDARAKIKSLEADPRSRRLLGHYRAEHVQETWKTPVVLGVLAAAVLAFVVDRWRKKAHGYSVECEKCGRTFCALCKPAGESTQYCSQCVHVYLKKDGVAIETKLQKIDEVKRRKARERRLRRLANVFLPGSAAFLESRPAIAALALVLFFLGLYAAFGWDSFGVVPRPEVTSGVVRLLSCLLIALAGWLIGQAFAEGEV